MNAKINNPKHSLVYVVIPNWNGKDVIGDCIKSVKNQTYSHLKIIVVDNGSVDGSVEYIEKYFPDVILLKQPKNLGFAGGVNVGIKHAQAHRAKYVWLLNNDAKADKDCLVHLVCTAKEQNSDIVASVIITKNDTIIDSDGDVYGFYGLPYPRHRNAPISLKPNKDEKIISASGGASLYKIELFKEIGLFDEMYFAYYEDVDFSMRAQLSNKKIWVSHNAIVHHRMNHTSDRIPGFGQEMTIKNSIYLYWKIMPFQLVLKTFHKFLYANLRITAITVLHGHPWRALRAQMVAFLHIPQIYFRRRQIQGSRKISVKQLENILDKKNPFRALKKLDRSTPKK